jgi:hypothetical protein
MEKMKMMYNNGDIIKDCNRNIVANLTVRNVAYKLLCMYEVWSSWKGNRMPIQGCAMKKLGRDVKNDRFFFSTGKVLTLLKSEVSETILNFHLYPCDNAAVCTNSSHHSLLVFA